MISPVTVYVLLADVAVSLLVLASYGNLIRLLAKKYLPQDFDVVENVALVFAFGATLIPIVVMILTLLDHSLNSYVAYLITLVVLAVNIIYYRSKFRWSSIRLSVSRVGLNWGRLLPFFVFLSIFAITLSPAIGLYVHPGDDPKLYSLIATRITVSGGYTTSWGPNVDPSWVSEKIHLAIAGFSGINAYFSEITLFDIGNIVLISTLVFKSLISLGVYFFAKRIFKRRAAGLLSAFSFCLLATEPIFGWFSWGGNAEISSLFLLLIQLGLYLDYLDKGERRLGEIVVIAFLTAGMIALHPFSIFYSLACVIPCTVYFMAIRRKVFRPLEALLAFAISAIFILPMLVTALQEELAIMPLYSSTPQLWTPMISWGQSLEANGLSVIVRMATVYGPMTVILYIFCLDQTFHHVKGADMKPYYLLALWALALFLLSENNPNGLFTVKFPLWYRVDANRTFVATSLPFSIAVGTGLSFILRAEIENVGSKIQLRGLARNLWKRRLSIIVILLIAAQISINAFVVGTARNNSPITEADAKSFDWITTNTSKDSSFFVFPNDAGQWIPIYTDRRAVIPFGVATDHKAMGEYYKTIYPLICQNPADVDVLNYLSDNNVSYVYIGSKTVLPTIYSFTPNVGKFLDSDIYELVYQEDGAFVFKYRGATFTTLWENQNFSSGWEFGGWAGAPVYKSNNETLSMKASTPQGYAYASHDLSVDNSQSLIYLDITWQTENETTLKAELTINGAIYTLINREESSTWTTSTISINEYAIGSITSIKIIIDGKGFGSISSLNLKQLSPLRK